MRVELELESDSESEIESESALELGLVKPEGGCGGSPWTYWLLVFRSRQVSPHHPQVNKAATNRPVCASLCTS